MQYNDAQSGKDYVTYLTLSPVQMTFHGTGSSLQASHDQVRVCLHACYIVTLNVLLSPLHFGLFWGIGWVQTFVLWLRLELLIRSLSLFLELGLVFGLVLARLSLLSRVFVWIEKRDAPKEN